MPDRKAVRAPIQGGIPTPPRSRPAVLVPAAIVAAVIIVAFGVWWFVLRGPSLALTNAAALTDRPGVEFQPAISPDGQQVAYAAGAIGAPRLAVGSVAGGAGGEVRLAGGAFERAQSPSWTPDGARVRFRGCSGARCDWYEVAKAGGEVRPAKLPQRARYATEIAWSQDGQRVAFVAWDTIFVTAPADTAARQLAVHRERFWTLHSLAWSPDGKLIAYANGNPEWPSSGNAVGSSLWVIGLDTGTPKEVANEEFLNVSPVWLDNAHLLFVSNRAGARGTYVVRVSDRGAVGKAHAVPGITDPHSLSYTIGGQELAWSKFTTTQNIWSYPLGGGTVSIAGGQPVTSGKQVIQHHDVSPDGRTLLFDSDRRGNMDLYRVSTGGGEPAPVTDYPQGEFWPRWSPDGRTIAFSAEDSTCVGGLDELMTIPAEGGPPAQLTCSMGWDETPAWSPDGLSLAFISYRSGRGEIWGLNRTSVTGAWGDPKQITDFGTTTPFDWAPRGRQLLVSRGRTELVVMTPDGQVISRLDLVAANGLRRLGDVRYSRDGSTIYIGAVHQDGREGIWALPAQGGAARLVVAFDDPVLAAAAGGAFSVGPDRLYLTVSQFESDVWTATLRR